MRRLRSRPAPATLISLVALFVALGGTSYAALTISGKNVKNGSLSGADIKNNSLTGADIAESKLGKVRAAKSADSARTAGHASTADSARTAGNATALGGSPASAFARVTQDTQASAFAGTCNPESTLDAMCGSTTVTVSRTARLVLLGELDFGASTAPAAGSCRYLLDGSALAGSRSFGTDVIQTVNVYYDESATFNAMTNPIPAGQHTVALQCNEEGGKIVFDLTRVTILTVSPN